MYISKYSTLLVVPSLLSTIVTSLILYIPIRIVIDEDTVVPV